MGTNKVDMRSFFTVVLFVAGDLAIRGSEASGVVAGGLVIGTDLLVLVDD